MSNCSASLGPVCFGKGECLPSEISGTYRCVWQSEKLLYADSWAYVTMGVLLLLLSLMFLLEIAVDIARKRVCGGGKEDSFWRNPIFFCKFFAFCACIARCTFFFMSANEAIADMNYGRWQKTFVEVVSALTIAITYTFQVLVWISAILKAKSLGDSSKQIKRYRIVVFLVMMLAPIFFFVAMFNVFSPEDARKDIRDLLNLSTIVIRLLFFLALLIGTTIFVVQVLRRSTESLKEGKANKALRSATRRTKALLVANVFWAILMIFQFCDFVIDESDKNIIYSFLSLVIVDFCQVVILYCFFIMSESYFTSKRFPGGYTNSISSFRNTGTVEAGGEPSDSGESSDPSETPLDSRVGSTDVLPDSSNPPSDAENSHSVNIPSASSSSLSASSSASSLSSSVSSSISSTGSSGSRSS